MINQDIKHSVWHLHQCINDRGSWVPQQVFFMLKAIFSNGKMSAWFRFPPSRGEFITATAAATHRHLFTVRAGSCFDRPHVLRMLSSGSWHVGSTRWPSGVRLRCVIAVAVNHSSTVAPAAPGALVGEPLSCDACLKSIINAAFSLSCVKRHKLEHGCSGSRSKTAFVPLHQFSDNLLYSGESEVLKSSVKWRNLRSLHC